MKYEIWKSNNQWFWHLKSPNGKVVSQGQPIGYKSKAGALKGIRASQKANSKTKIMEEYQLANTSYKATRQIK